MDKTAQLDSHKRGRCFCLVTLHCISAPAPKPSAWPRRSNSRPTRSLLSAYVRPYSHHPKRAATNERMSQPMRRKRRWGPPLGCHMLFWVVDRRKPEAMRNHITSRARDGGRVFERKPSRLKKNRRACSSWGVWGGAREPQMTLPAAAPIFLRPGPRRRRSCLQDGRACVSWASGLPQLPRAPRPVHPE